MSNPEPQCNCCTTAECQADKCEICDGTEVAYKRVDVDAEKAVPCDCVDHPW
jgi:hypothetical protein